VNTVNLGLVWGDMYSQAGKEFWKANQPYVDVGPLMDYKGDEETQRKTGADPPNFDGIVKEGMGGRRLKFTSEIAGVVDAVLGGVHGRRGVWWERMGG